MVILRTTTTAVLNRRHSIAACALLVAFRCFAVATAEEQEKTTTTTTTSPRFGGAKDWYLENIKVGNVELPFNLVTLVITVLSVYVLFKGLFAEDPNKPKCTASHILLPDSTDATKAKMEDFKKAIGSDKEIFAKYAKEHSTCPSKSNGGLLGNFPKGAMVPPFDKVCFAPETPVGTTIGPVQTHFGYHLIYIHDRKLPEVQREKLVGR